MNRELKRVTLFVLMLFTGLLISSTTIQFFSADALNNDPRNTRTLYASYSRERGAILVGGQPIAQSVPSDDNYKHQRVYTDGVLYSAITGYFTLNQGSTGLENSMNSYLDGTDDSQFFNQINTLVTGQKPKGASVELTINPVVQKAAFDALGTLQGAVIAVEIKTGRILALVSTPGFDPNSLAQHDTNSVITTYKELLSNPSDPLINRGIAGDLNPPGSTFKIVTSAAALQNAGLPADYALPNPARYQLPGSSSTVSNSGGGRCGGGDTVTIQTAFILSCNVPFAELGVQMGKTKLNDMATAFGFNTSSTIPMRTEASTFPPIADDAQLALSSFGQSSVRASPLQIVELSMAVANGGKIMKPTLIEAVRAPDLSVIEKFEAQELSQPLTSITSSTLSAWMVQAVSNGAASNARIDGVAVAGKTGTAENGKNDPYTLWFTGFAPADDPQVAVAVVVEDGGGKGQSGTGNAIAAPIGKKVLEAVLIK